MNRDDLRDLRDMIEIINTTIEINAKEEEFYRRSAAASGREGTRDLFLEIANEVAQFLNTLRARRQNLWSALHDLETAQKKSR